MKVFGISDLHLSATGEKPMAVFGPEWRGHREKIERNWRRVVGAKDLVLLPGDLSWAMTLDEARPDLSFIESLPGVKYFIRGNHDFWYSGPGKVRAALGPSLHTLRFDAAVVRRVAVFGVRGWLMPGHADYDLDTDGRIWQREALRLDLSVGKLAGLSWDVAVAMFHFPPRGAGGGTPLSEAVAAAGARYCIYGHLHGQDARAAFAGEADGVIYRCVSADVVDFTPALLFEHGG